MYVLRRDRIKYGKATINEAACTDCGMCLKTCPRQAIYVEQDDFNQIFKFSYRIILLPSVFIGQFPEDISEEQIFSELHNLGFHYVMEVDKSTGLLMEETKHYLQQHPRQRPFISSFCPGCRTLDPGTFSFPDRTYRPLKTSHGYCSHLCQEKIHRQRHT